MDKLQIYYRTSFLFRVALSDEALGQTGQTSQTHHAMWLWIRLPRVPAEVMPSLGIPQGSLGTIPRDSSPRLVLSRRDLGMILEST